MATRLILRALVLPHGWVAFSILAAGCGGGNTNAAAQDSAAPRVFVGDLSGTDARVGIVASSSHARFYFCGGPASYLTSTRWVPAAVTSAGEASAQAGDWQLDATLHGQSAKGTVVESDGASYPFSAAEVAPGTLAGLYETASPCGKVGLIVAQASPAAPASGQGACIGGDSAAPSVRQVNPILPITRDASGAVHVLVDQSSEEASVRAATP